MNVYQVVEKINEFTKNEDFVIICESDWNRILDMIKASADEKLYARLAETSVEVLPMTINQVVDDE